MHKRNSIVSLPMLIGTVLSLTLHGVAFYGKSDIKHAPPQPLMEKGRTVVHLTLMPSISSQAAAPAPQESEPVEQPLDIPVPLPVETAPTATAPAETRSVNSVERDASPQEEKGVAAEISLVGPFRPTYPRVSKRRGETGTVTLSVHVLADGSVANVTIRHSSGYRRLDEAALKAARACTFTPSVADSHNALSYTFTLTND